MQVSTALLIDGDRMLLGHRHPNRRSHPDVWDLPGGHLESGESAIDAIVRELHEELDVDVSPFVTHPWTTLWAHDVEVTVFVITAWHGTVTNKQPHEHDELAWFLPAEVGDLDLAPPLDPELLARAMADHPSS